MCRKKSVLSGTTASGNTVRIPGGLTTTWPYFQSMIAKSHGLRIDGKSPSDLPAPTRSMLKERGILQITRPKSSPSLPTHVSKAIKSQNFDLLLNVLQSGLAASDFLCIRISLAAVKPSSRIAVTLREQSGLTAKSIRSMNTYLLKCVNSSEYPYSTGTELAQILITLRTTIP